MLSVHKKHIQSTTNSPSTLRQLACLVV